MAEVDDKQLVKQVKKGDKKAFDLLVLKYQHRIAVLVARFVPPDDVPDVTQEAFVKAYRAMAKFRGDSQFYTWLYRIAVNTAKNHLVSRGRRPPSQDVDIDESYNVSANRQLNDTAGPDKQLMSQQLLKVLEQAIAELPEELRTALTLREYEGMSYDDIAHAMNCPVGTVRSRIFRAREAVEAAIRPLKENTSES